MLFVTGLYFWPWVTKNHALSDLKSHLIRLKTTLCPFMPPSCRLAKVDYEMQQEQGTMPCLLCINAYAYRVHGLWCVAS